MSIIKDEWSSHIDVFDCNIIDSHKNNDNGNGNDDDDDEIDNKHRE